MTSDDSLTTGAPPEAPHAQTLGKWVATLAEDALSVAEVSQQFAPGAPLRAPLRAGLRHLLHIERLSRGIEALAMLEVSLLLRVTALLASPAEELDSETVLRLRADTPLIEELFPNEKDAIWRFCETLIETERGLPSEQPVALDAQPPGEATEAVASAQADAAHEPAWAAAVDSEGVSPEATPTAARSAQLESAGPEATSWEEAGRDGRADADAEPAPAAGGHAEESERELTPASETAETSEPAANVMPSDELVERVRAWAASYRAPTFGAKPHDLTRACAFVRTRVSAWAGL